MLPAPITHPSLPLVSVLFFPFLLLLALPQVLGGFSPLIQLTLSILQVTNLPRKGFLVPVD